MQRKSRGPSNYVLTCYVESAVAYVLYRARRKIWGMQMQRQCDSAMACGKEKMCALDILNISPVVSV